MAVAVHELRGEQIPASFRGPRVHAVWLVVANGEAFKYCTTEAEAFALAAVLEQELEQEYEPEPEPYRPSGPRMR